MLDLYELVQHAGRVLPRLYLLLTVGGVYICSKEAPAKDIMRDLSEMCRGVQHPMRGLFLRNYLGQITKSALAGAASEESLDGAGGSLDGAVGPLEDAIDFVLHNFGEMNRLWVRMQHQGSVQEREKRERERSELRILVGTNLATLSQLEGVTLELYGSTVLPAVLEQIVNCKDPIAQRHLFECLAQVFPVEFHVATLTTVLKHLDYLSPATDQAVVLLSLMGRLAAHLPAADEQLESCIYTPVATHVGETLTKLAEADELELGPVMQLHKGLVQLALAVYPARLNYVDDALNQCAAIVHKLAPAGSTAMRPPCRSLLLQLAEDPLERYPSVLTALELKNWPRLCSLLALDAQKRVANLLLAKVSEQGALVRAVDKCDELLTFIAPLLHDDPSRPVAEEDAALGDEELSYELSPLSASLFALTHTDTDEHSRILSAARRHLAATDERRLPFTLVPLVFVTLRLVRCVRERVAADETVEVGCHKLLAFAARAIEAIKPVAPELAFRLFLQCAQAADAVGEEEDAYEFVTQAFVVYEDDISDSQAKLAAITLATATLPQLASFSQEQYETLSTSATQYGARLLKKPDQARAVMRSSYLFWQLTADGVSPLRNPTGVLECLQRALKIADGCKHINQHTLLFIEALEAYLWHYDQGNELVTATYVSSLMQLIEQRLSEEGAAEEEQMRSKDIAGISIGSHHLRYKLTKAHISHKRTQDARYAKL